MATQHATFGTYHVGSHGPGLPVITFFGSDADTARKGWRSIGCQSVSASDLPATIAAIERGGRKQEMRGPAEMARIARGD